MDKMLDEFYKSQRWKEFGELFHSEYSKGNEVEQLRMLRMLLCEWRDERAMKVVVSLKTLDN